MDKNDFSHGHGNYFKSAILKVTWNQLFSKLSTSTRHISNRIWKTTLQLKSSRTWINIRVNSFSGKIMKQKWAKVPWKLLIAQKSKPVLWGILHQGISLIIVFFFFSEASLVFNFSLVSRSNNFQHNLVIFLPFDTLCILEFIQCL